MRQGNRFGLPGGTAGIGQHCKIVRMDPDIRTRIGALQKFVPIAARYEQVLGLVIYGLGTFGSSNEEARPGIANQVFRFRWGIERAYRDQPSTREQGSVPGEDELDTVGQDNREGLSELQA